MSGPVVLAGGGTGGHVFVARAVAQALVAKGLRPEELRFVGSQRGQERELLATSGIELVLLPGRGLLRRLSVRAFFQNLGSLWAATRALTRSVVLLHSWKPRAVVSVGGYAAAPAALAAVLLRRPLILVNVDAVPGLTHRLLGRFATASCVASTGSGLPREVPVGIPVRAEFASFERSDASRARARAALGLPQDAMVIGVTTGSLGSRSVNQAILGVAQDQRLADATIFQISGRRDAEAVAASVADQKRAHHFVVPFCDDMASFYAACDLAVTRAGALSIGELAATGTPAVLVPLPGAPGDHQTKNAQLLVCGGAGVLLSDAALTARSLSDVVVELLGDPAHLAAMSAAGLALAHEDAAGEVAQVVLEHAR